MSNTTYTITDAIMEYAEQCGHCLRCNVIDWAVDQTGCTVEAADKWISCLINTGMLSVIDGLIEVA